MIPNFQFTGVIAMFNSLIGRLQRVLSASILAVTSLGASMVLSQHAMAQAPPTPPSRPVCGDAWCGSVSSPPRNYCPSCAAEQQEAQRQRNAANAQQKTIRHASDLNNTGVKEAKKGNWKKALELYKQAYAADPTDLYQGNIRGASLMLARQNGTRDLSTEQARLASAAALYNRGISAAEVAASARTNTLQNQAQQLGIGSSDLFSVRANINAPLPPLATAPLPTAQANSALEELSSIAKSSQQGAALASQTTSLADVNLDIAKALSNCGIDGAPCVEPDHLTYPHPVQTPAASALSDQISPAARQDPQIKQKLLEYDHLEMDRAEKQLRIDEVSRSIQQGGDNLDVLQAYRQSLQAQAEQDKKLEADTAQIIHMRVDTIALPASVESPK